MELNESIENFYNIFLHLHYEFVEEDTYWDLFKHTFKHLVWISLNQFEYKPPYVHVSPTFVSCETPPISEEEPTFYFVPCLPPFPVPILMPPCYSVEVGKSINQISNPYSYHSSTFNDSDPMEEILEWFINQVVNTNASISFGDINTHNISFEYDLDSCHALSSHSHNPLPLDFPDFECSKINSDRCKTITLHSRRVGQ